MDQRRWRSPLAGLAALFALAGCAAAGDAPGLTVDPVDFDAIFGPGRTGAVVVAPKPDRPHPACEASNIPNRAAKAR